MYLLHVHVPCLACATIPCTSMLLRSSVTSSVAGSSQCNMLIRRTNNRSLISSSHDGGAKTLREREREREREGEGEREREKIHTCM